ncbi:MAG: hypothetical protein ABIF87_12625, partial [Pseudomonadota bacterium]
KKSRFSLKRHSGESRNPVNPITSGCRIKSGMTVLGLFTRPSILNFGHWYLFGIWFLVLGIFMIFIEQVSSLNSVNYLFK